jgi:hypothetical protein
MIQANFSTTVRFFLQGFFADRAGPGMTGGSPSRRCLMLQGTTTFTDSGGVLGIAGYSSLIVMAA